MSKKKQLEIPEEFKNSEQEFEIEVTPEVSLELDVIPPMQGIPAGFVLCKVAMEGNTPYTINREGVTYTFNPPSFTCPLPVELATLYDDGKHLIKIA